MSGTFSFGSLTQDQWSAVKRLIEWTLDDAEICRYDRDACCQTHVMHRRPCPWEVLATIPRSFP